jgi:hypothetical protein
MSNKKILSQLEKLLDSQVSILKQLGRWLTTRLSYATEHLPEYRFILEVHRVF